MPYMVKRYIIITTYVMWCVDPSHAKQSHTLSFFLNYTQDRLCLLIVNSVRVIFLRAQLHIKLVLRTA